MTEVKQFVVQNRVSGVIIPPPDIKAVCLKTAEFVAKKGPDFEEKILKSKESIRFSFLKPDDPYHAYYLEKIDEYIAKANQPSMEEEPTQEEETKIEMPKEENEQTNVASAQPSKLTPLVYLMRNIPDGPPPERQFDLYHPNIPLYDMDIIKLTAQYAAINGKKFISGLEQREANNPMFDFLKSTHILFSYFSNLITIYHKILHPTREIEKRLDINLDPMQILSHCIHRIEYRKIEEDQKRDVDKDLERIQFNSIDWNEFQVVETIELPELELEISSVNLSTPTTNNITQSLSTPNVQSSIHNNNNNNTLSSQNNNQNNNVTSTPLPLGQVPLPMNPPVPTYGQPRPMFPPQPPQPMPPQQKGQNQQYPPQSRFSVTSNINIKPNYKPQPVQQTFSVNSFVDPISHRPIPLDQAQKHINIELLDPNGLAQQDKFLQKMEGTNLVPDQIHENIKNMVQKRPDIFGDSSDVAIKKQKLNEDMNQDMNNNQNNYNEHTYQMMNGMGVNAMRNAPKGPIIGPQQNQ